MEAKLLDDAVEQDDATLALRAQTGDHDAFALLMQRHWRTAAWLAGRLVGDREEVADILQEAALAAYLNLRSLSSPARFAGWFCGIVLNHCRMHRRRAYRAPRSQTLDGDPASAGAPDPLASVEEGELLAQVAKAARLLPEAQRQAALLVYFDGMSLGEAADALGISSGALKVRLHRARQALRSQFDVPPRTASANRRPRRLTMVELDVFDVMTHQRTTKDGRDVTNAVIILREKDGRRVLPIWVGEPEAVSIALALQGFQPARPMTYHFAASLLEAAKAQVQSVTISRLVKETYYATVAVQRGRTVAQVDARPSDAINLALRVGAPIFAEEDVLAKQGRAVRVTKDERTGSAALVERFEERYRQLSAQAREEETEHARQAWRELGLEFLEE